MIHGRPDWNGRIVDLDGRIPEDEPVLLVRGQDIAAPATARAWADVIDTWQSENADRVKVPDMPDDVDDLMPNTGPIEWMPDEGGDSWCAVGVYHRSVENVMDWMRHVCLDEDWVWDDAMDTILAATWVIGVGTNDTRCAYDFMWSVSGVFRDADGNGYTPDRVFPVTIVQR